MNSIKCFVVIFAILQVTVLGKKSEGKDVEPGCENAKSINGTKAHDCCPGLPKVFTRSSWKDCSKTCGNDKKNFCCKVECVIKKFNVSDATGKFDAVKAKQLLKDSVNGSSQWQIDSIVDGCVASAPQKVKEWQEKMAKNGKGQEKACNNPENIPIMKCIRRELILGCPSWVKSEKCDKLKAFAKSCPRYPDLMRSNKDKKEATDEKKNKNGKSAEGKKGKN